MNNPFEFLPHSGMQVVAAVVSIVSAGAAGGAIAAKYTDIPARLAAVERHEDRLEAKLGDIEILLQQEVCLQVLEVTKSTTPSAACLIASERALIIQARP